MINMGLILQSFHSIRLTTAARSFNKFLGLNKIGLDRIRMKLKHLLWQIHASHPPPSLQQLHNFDV